MWDIFGCPGKFDYKSILQSIDEFRPQNDFFALDYYFFSELLFFPFARFPDHTFPLGFFCLGKKLFMIGISNVGLEAKNFNNSSDRFWKMNKCVNHFGVIEYQNRVFGKIEYECHKRIFYDYI